MAANLIVSTLARRQKHIEANFIGITILQYSTHRVSHPRYRFFIVMAINKLSNSLRNHATIDAGRRH